MELVHTIDIRRLKAAVDFGLQVVIFNKPVVAAGRHNKSVLNPQMKPVSEFSQVGDFASHLIGHILVHIVQRNDDRSLRGWTVMGNEGIDF